jgi:hypothetical protein
MVGGMEALRHQAIRDFPEETWDVGLDHWRGRAQSALLRRRGGSRPGA